MALIPSGDPVSLSSDGVISQKKHVDSLFPADLDHVSRHADWGIVCGLCDLRDP